MHIREYSNYFNGAVGLGLYVYIAEKIDYACMTHASILLYCINIIATINRIMLLYLVVNIYLYIISILEKHQLPYLTVQMTKILR